jgi:hypothetical protein
VPEGIVDPVLGPLRPDPDLPWQLKGAISVDGQNLPLNIDPDGDPMADCLAFARAVHADADMLTAKARAVAAGELLDNYNDNWRCYGITEPDGTVKDVENQALSSAQFQARLCLKGIRTCGASMIEFCFADDGMFAGHAVFVLSFDGVTFSETSAELFG